MKITAAQLGEMYWSFRKAVAVFGLTLMAIVVLACLTKAHAHDWRRPDLDAWYSGLRNPRSSSSAVRNVGCCSKDDCHETEADMRGNDWWARLGMRHGLDWELADWVKVPAEAILLNQTNPTGNAVICHSVTLSDPTGNGTRGDAAAATVFCFIPPAES
jgi:hypothetical protein